MPAFVQQIMDFIIAFDLADILAVGIGVLAVVVSLIMPMSGSDHSDRYGMANYSLAIVFVAVTAMIATPMIWHGQHGIFYSFCFCLVIGTMAAARWHLLGRENTVVVKSLATPAAQQPGAAAHQGEGKNGSN